MLALQSQSASSWPLTGYTARMHGGRSDLGVRIVGHGAMEDERRRFSVLGSTLVRRGPYTRRNPSPAAADRRID